MWNIPILYIETYMTLVWITLLSFETYVKHAHPIPTNVKYPWTSWILCETCPSFWNLYDTKVKHLPSIWNLCETCTSYSNLYETNVKYVEYPLTFQKLYDKIMYHLMPNMWITLIPFWTNVKHAHLSETYMPLMWNTLLPFDTYVKHAHLIPSYIYETNVKHPTPKQIETPSIHFRIIWKNDLSFDTQYVKYTT
jgi:hypothetical protein